MVCSNCPKISAPKLASDVETTSEHRRVVLPMRSGFWELARGALIALFAAAGMGACQGLGDIAELGWEVSDSGSDRASKTVRRVFLAEGWLLKEAAAVPQSGATLTAASFSPSEWYRATVPGTVLTSLVNEGVYPEPLYGLNNLRIPESLNRTPFWYWKSFELPAGYAGKQVWLNLDGINYEAELWLNAERLGGMKGAFKRAKFNITRLARFDRPNSLAVMILPPPHPGTPHEQTLTDAGQNGGGLGEDSPTFVASIGWDWMPAIRDRNMGIWQEVYLSETGPLVIEFPHVVTDLPLPDTSQADLRISAEVKNASNVSLDGILKGTIEGISFEQAVTVGPNETRLVLFDKGTFPQLTLQNPRLWWPNGYGEPAMYSLDLELRIGSEVSSSQRVRFGVREMSYRQNKFEPSVDIPFAPRVARYVRMYGLKRATSWGFSLWEFAVFGQGSGATNLARQKPCSASSTESAELSPSAAFDGAMNTRWSSLYSEPQWIMVDLGAAQTVNRVHLEWEIAYASDYRIQTSTDGKQWQDAYHYVGTTQLQVLVNGQRIMCKGGNWGMDEAMKRVSRERYAAQIRLHKEANLTMIRNWVGQTDDEDFYDLCDENGLLIWDDFWLANPVDGPDPVNPELFLENARDKIKRYRNHPSIAL